MTEFNPHLLKAAALQWHAVVWLLPLLVLRLAFDRQGGSS